MWSDVKIGDVSKMGNVSHGIWKASESEHNISENRTSYWITGALDLRIGMTIMKDTEEGKWLFDLLREVPQREEAIIDFIDRTAFKHVDFDVFIPKLQDKLEGAYAAGRKSKLREILKP